MKPTTILYLENLLKREQANLHSEVIQSINLCYNITNGKCNTDNKTYSKIDDVLYLGYRQRLENIEEMIRELENLLPK